MGVQGFTNFIKKKTPRVGVPIDLKDEANKKKIIIGIDGLSYIFHVVNSLSRSNSLKLFGESVREFFQFLKLSNIDCIVFVDGLEPLYKRNEHDKRFKQRAEQYTNSATESYLDTQSKSITHYQYPSPMFSKEFSSILRDMNVPIYVSKFEADRGIAQWAADNPTQIYGIISNDSDFFFYQGLSCYFFPLDQISINPSINSIVVVGYTVDRISNSLGIKQNKLPLLASLIGNDSTKHIRGNKNFRPKGNQDRVQTIINMVKNQNCSNLALIKEIFFVNAKDQQLINESIESYILELDIDKLSFDQLIFEESTKTVFRLSNDIKIKFPTLISSKSTIVDPNQSQITLEDVLFSISGHTSRVYNFSKLIYKEYHTTRYCFEPSMPYENSILTYMRSVSAYFYGLCDTMQQRVGSKVEELQQNLDGVVTIEYVPKYLTYSYEQCYKEIVPFNRRILDFCTIFQSVPLYQHLINNDKKEINLLNFNFYHFYFINCWRYILSFKEFIFKIEEWMVDSFILHVLLLENKIKIQFQLENDSFQPLYLAEFYQLLLRWCFDISDAMALPKTINIKHQQNQIQLQEFYPGILFETTLIHPIWRIAKSNFVKASKLVNQNERIQILFNQIYSSITPKIIEDFIIIKSIIYKK